MSVFRAEFYETLLTMQKLTAEPLLTDVFPPTALHNIGAKILRTGIGVSAFAMLEKYVKSVFDAMVIEISRARIVYRDFPDELKKFIVVDSMSGLTNSASFIKNSMEKLSFLESSVLTLSSYSKIPPVYTSYGFSPTGSNVGHEDLKKGFAAFGISDAWRRLNSIASLIGSSSLDLENDYRNLARVRNSSAHAATNIPTNDLQSNIQAAIVIGMCVDLLGLDVARTIRECSNHKRLQSELSAITCHVRFLDQSLDGKWHERPTALSRVVKKHDDKVSGVTGMVARRSNLPIVIRNASTKPIELAL